VIEAEVALCIAGLNKVAVRVSLPVVGIDPVQLDLDSSRVLTVGEAKHSFDRPALPQLYFDGFLFNPARTCGTGAEP
jgi:hypothetical protein